MPLIKLENKTPAVYTQESRDFQLLCRLFDCIVNGVKFDIDTIPNINNTMQTRGNILALLQTKVGFFTEYDINDDIMRYVLASFPEIIKLKGSLKAIKEAINVFLKAHEITGQVTIWSSGEESGSHSGVQADDHTLIIGLNTVVRNLYVLEEIFRYIIPTGYGVRFYFYNNISELQKYVIENKAKLIFASNSINSILRPMVNEKGQFDPEPLIYPQHPYLKNPKDLFDEKELEMGYDASLNSIGALEIISSLDGGTAYENNRFLGFFQSTESVTSQPGDYFGVIVDTEMSLYYNNNRDLLPLNYLGVLQAAPATPKEGDTWTIKAGETFTHYMYDGVETKTNPALYALCMELINSDVEYDIARVYYKDAAETSIQSKDILNNTAGFVQKVNEYEGRTVKPAFFKWDALNRKIVFKNIIALDNVSLQGANMIDISFLSDCTFEATNVPSIIRSVDSHLLFNMNDKILTVNGHSYDTFAEIKAVQTENYLLPYTNISDGDLIEAGELYAYMQDSINYIVQCTKSGRFNITGAEAAEVKYLILPIIAYSDFSQGLDIKEGSITLEYSSTKKTYVDGAGQPALNITIQASEGGE